MFSDLLKGSRVARPGTDFVTGAMLSEGQAWQAQHFRKKTRADFVANAALFFGLPLSMSWAFLSIVNFGVPSPHVRDTFAFSEHQRPPARQRR